MFKAYLSRNKNGSKTVNNALTLALSSMPFGKILSRSLSISVTIMILIASLSFTAHGMPVNEGEYPANANMVSTSDYIILFDDMDQNSLNIAQEKIESIVKSANGEIIAKFAIINGMAVSIPDNTLSKIKAVPGVKNVEKDQKAYLQMDNVAEQINVKDVWSGAWEGSSTGLDGTGIKILMVDSGVDATHPDLSGKISGWKNCLVGDTRTDCYDDNGHGTFVASQIAGTGIKSSPSIKLTGLKDVNGQQLYGGPFKGIAPGAELYSAKVSGADGSSSIIPILRGLDWAYQEIHPDIVSISMASLHSDALEEAVKKLYYSDITVIVAAGNSGPSGNTIMCPGDSPYVITVGSVNRDDYVSAFSSRGPTNTGGFKPDVVACGNDVIAAKPVLDINTNDNFLTYYQILSGTSMATPEVAGVVALMQQYNKAHENGNLLIPDQVKHVLTMTARHPNGATSDYIRDFRYGYGIVDAENALLYLKDPNSNIPSAPEKPMVTVFFDKGSIAVKEDTDNVAIKIKAVWSPGIQQEAFNILYSANSNTAIANKNYKLEPGSVTFYPGDPEKVINLDLIDDRIPGSSMDLFIKISCSDPSVFLSQATSKITLIDVNEQIVKFDVNSYTVNENTGTFDVDVIVDRSNVDPKYRQAVSVKCIGIDGTAYAGNDYGIPTTLIQFSTGQGIYYPDIEKAKLSVTINDPSLKTKPMKYFILQLKDPVNAKIGSPGSSKVCIYYSDDENIDKIAPDTQEMIPPAPSSGWYVNDVSVTFSAGDTGGSGLRDTEYDLNGDGWLKYTGSPVPISKEGENILNFRSWDNAGNVEVAETHIIRIDTTAPISECIVDDSSFRIISSDTGGSGIDQIKYRYDNTGDYNTYTWPENIPDGKSSIQYYAIDKAGNIEGIKSHVLDVQNEDGIAPTTACSLSGTAGNNGWYKSNVEVILTSSDNEGGSGVKSTSYKVDSGAWNIYSGKFTIDTEGEHLLYFRSEDNAGNIEIESSEPLKIDLTAPSLTGIKTPGPNGAGWNDQDVTVHFTAVDIISGVASCTPDVILSSDGSGQYVTGTAIDNAGNSASFTVGEINIDKTPPSISSIQDPAPINGWNNVDVTVKFTATDIGSGLPDGADKCDMTISQEGKSIPVTWQTFDIAGNTNSKTVLLNIDKTPPVLSLNSAPVNPVPIKTKVSVSYTLDDGQYGSGLDINSVIWSWDDGTTSAGTVNGNTITGEHIYNAANVASVILNIKDLAGNPSSARYDYIVAYDPNGGFVTGGGWINSPAGAYIEDTSLTGKASFGFVSKYLKGSTIPSGNTEFQFHVANMNFKSTSYDWLVIAGAKAQYKGTGTIDGAGNYGFILTAIDGSLLSGKPDTFRIKIWDKATGAMIYDNMLGTADDADPTTILGGGNIVVHKK